MGVLPNNWDNTPFRVGQKPMLGVCPKSGFSYDEAQLYPLHPILTHKAQCVKTGHHPN